MKKILSLLSIVVVTGSLYAQQPIKKTTAPAKSKSTKPAAAKATAPKPAVVLKNAKDSAGYAYALLMGKGMKAEGVDTTMNVTLFQKVFADVMKGDTVGMVLSDADSRTFLQTYFGAIQQKQQEAQMKKMEAENILKFKDNKEAGEKFLAENKTKPGVQTTPSGLQYQVIKEGTGATPSADDEVEVHYTGMFTDGQTFDSSVERGEPARFPVNGVITGWVEGLQLMKEGAKYKFFVPHELAYGVTGGGETIKPFSVLVFEVELLKIIKE